MARKHWTTQELKLLREHYNTIPAEEMAAMLGRTKSAVVQTAKRYGIVRKPYRYTLGIDPNKILVRVSQRKTIPTIARELGTSEDYIKRAIRKMPTWVQDRAYRNGKNASCKAAGKATSEVMRKRREAA